MSAGQIGAVSRGIIVSCPQWYLKTFCSEVARQMRAHDAFVCLLPSLSVSQKQKATTAFVSNVVGSGAVLSTLCCYSYIQDTVFVWWTLTRDVHNTQPLIVKSVPSGQDVCVCVCTPLGMAVYLPFQSEVTPWCLSLRAQSYFIIDKDQFPSLHLTNIQQQQQRQEAESISSKLKVSPLHTANNVNVLFIHRLCH